MDNFSTVAKAQPDIRETYERLDIDALDNAILNMSRLADEATMRGNEREAEKWQERVLVARDVWEDRIQSVEALALGEPEMSFGEWMERRAVMPGHRKPSEGFLLELVYMFDLVEMPRNPESPEEIVQALKKYADARQVDIDAVFPLFFAYKVEVAGGEQG